MDNRVLLFLRRYGILIIFPILGVLVTYMILNGMFFTPVNSSSKDIIRVEVAQGKTLGDIARDLKEKGLVRSSMSLRIISRLRGTDTRISSGEYELSPSMTPKEILSKLTSGEVVKRTVLVREGANMWDIAASLEEAGLVSKNEFTGAATSEELLKKAGITAKSFEGYLFPETYNLSRPISAEKILWTMLEEGEKHWPEEFTIQADTFPMSRHEILTLASIIEKEAGNAEEMPDISSVFHNRLKQGWRLQSDPTVIYGIPNFNGNLTRADLESPSPYNTYMNFGLPPGPIANPGEKAIRAALYPRDTSFMYFVSNNQGSHIFSTTLKEHNDAVETYQKGKTLIPPEGSAPGTPSPDAPPVTAPAP